jgi:hypothetical protein
MKKIYLFVYSLLSISCFSYSSHHTHYSFINKLADDSKIKLVCRTHQSSRFELSEIESACSTLNHRLKLLFNDVHTISDFLVANPKEAHNHAASMVLSEDIEKAIEIILKDASDEVKFTEYTNIYRSVANHQIKDKVRNKRINQKEMFTVPQSEPMP